MFERLQERRETVLCNAQSVRSCALTQTACRLTVYQRPKNAPGSGAAGKVEIGWGPAVAIVIGLVIAAVLMA